MQNNLNYLARVKKEFGIVHRLFEASPAMQKILSGEMTIDHNKSYLRQTYHYTEDNPQIQALATVYFHDSDRELVKMFYKHAISEIGDDELALNDLKYPSENVDAVRSENHLHANLVEFPAVVRGKTRFRFQVMATHQKSEIERAAKIMAESRLLAINELEYSICQNSTTGDLWM